MLTVRYMNELLMATGHLINKLMGESFQDYSWIYDFEEDFPQKVFLKSWIQEIILASLIYFQSVRTIDHLIL